jgi:hypothetical protein
MLFGEAERSTMNTSKTVLVVAVLTLTGCSGPTAPAEKSADKAETVAPPVPVTAKTAFYAMYKSARGWATDLLPLTIEAKTIKGIQNEDGKAAMWVATFGSSSRRQFSTYTYAVAAEPPDVRKGVTAATALPWAGPTGETLPFQSSDFAIDSDEAYKTAAAKAEPWLQKHPGKELTELKMGAANRFPGPVWYFLWGDKKDGFFAFVSASTGKALK